MATEIYLQRNHFRVTIADGEAGLRALENEQVDLMMIDIFMPHIRGFESIRIFHGARLAEHRAVSAIGLAR